MTGSVLRNPVVRKEDPKFITTGGRYIDDLRDVAELAGAAPFEGHWPENREPCVPASVRRTHTSAHIAAATAPVGGG